MQQMVPETALSASQSRQNAADSSRGGTICVIIAAKCYRYETQQIVPGPALSASISAQNAADGTTAGTICVTIGSKCNRWYQRRHNLRQYRVETQQIVLEAALSASLLWRNAADGTIAGTICVTIGSKCSRWFQRRHYLRHYRLEMQQIVP